MNGRPFTRGGETFTVFEDSKDNILVCFLNKTISSNGLWRAENPLTSALPVLVTKMIMGMVLTRIFILAFKRFHQPRIVSEILGGLLMSENIKGNLFPNLLPFSSGVTTETVANFVLVYHMFLLGLELDFKPILRARKKALSIALSGIVFSIFVGWFLHRYLLFQDFVQQTKGMPSGKGPFFWGITLATTNFPDLARILADLKLLYSDVGGIALSASIISDLCSCFLFLFGMAVLNDNKISTVGLTLAFIGLCVFVVRPILSWFINSKRAQEHSNYNDQLTCFVLGGVVFSGLITDACGSHSIVGPFVLGVIMPKGDFSKTLTEKLRNFVPGILMPIFYSINGGKANFLDIRGYKYTENQRREDRSGTTEARLVWVFVIAFAAKIMSTSIAALINKMPPRDSLALGVLMNTKGLLALIIINSARDLKALNKQTFVIMLVMIWVMTFFVGPFVAYVYKSNTKPSVKYKQRNVESIGPNSELRILACTHTSFHVPGIINLIDASNPIKESPIHVLAVHLVELTGHASAMLVVHDACKSGTTTNDELQLADYSSSSNAFDIYATQRESVTVQTLTAVSAYATMHEDIGNLAEENRVALIIIPFHKQSALLDGAGAIQDSKNSHLKSLNMNLIESAKCSVGIFVDRGLGASNYSNSHRHFALLFIGGVDDREALAYAGRMAGHPMVSLTVIQFNIMCKDQITGVCSNDNDDGMLEAISSTGTEKKLDDMYMDEFALRSMNNSSTELLKKSVMSWKQIFTPLNSIEREYDMVLVGRRHGSMSGVSSMLPDFDSSDGLGVLGDALVSSNFMGSTSILIVQQGGHLDHD